MLVGSKYDEVRVVPTWVSVMAVISFTIYCLGLTVVIARDLKHIHYIKDRDGYPHDPTDIKYDSN